MLIRVLGCSGTVAKDCRTTSFLVDDSLLVDAGTGVGDLTLDEMRRIDHVVLTHSHLDHIAALPLMVDAVAALREQPLFIHALPQTLQALQAHVFNNVIWPDFTRIPTPEKPFVRTSPLLVGQQLMLAGKRIEVLPAVHTVPGCGFAVSDGEREGTPCWVFTGDTERNPAFWARINQLPVGMLVIETAFCNADRALAKVSLHLSPTTLADELDFIDPAHHYPIYITHTKPAQTDRIMAEIERAELDQPGGVNHRHDVRWLRAGQMFVL